MQATDDIDVSLLICTRNRAGSLRETLRSIAATEVPASYRVELLVVDNGSTDQTAEVVEAEAPSALHPRRVVEPTPGLSRARNAGIAAARGDVLLFTDDDVQVPSNWIEPMAAPILEGTADAVAGGVRLAEFLRRGWMSDLHASLLADTTAQQRRGETRLVGANMAIDRSVLVTVGGFDSELGAGPESLGFHEETLLTLQLQKGDRHIETVYEVAVEHHPAPDRLQHDAYASSVEQLGRSDAYLDYHWRHVEGRWLRSVVAHAVWTSALWTYRRLMETDGQWDPSREGMAPIEMNLRRRQAYHRQMMQMVGTPRKYKQFGIRKHSDAEEDVSEGGESTPHDLSRHRKIALWS